MKPFIKTSAKDWRIFIHAIDAIIATTALVNVGIMAWTYASEGTFDFRWQAWFHVPVLLFLRMTAVREKEIREDDPANSAAHQKGWANR